jgi:phosphoribosyl 1,2-cyclic phosphodiesterase
VDSFFKILGSSSNGNAAFLNTGYSKILIDAGFSGKKIREKLEAIGESIDSLDAVFLTHEHSDHSVGIRGLSQRKDLPIFANQDTADALQTKLKKSIYWKIFQTGSEFRFRDLSIRSYSLPHDAYDPVGFNFHWGSGSDDLFLKHGSLAWVTDLGYIPEHVKQNILKVDTLVIESNFEESLLNQDTKRPWSIKQRIKGRHGHLSNKVTFDFLNEILDTSKIKTLYLAHLSKDCNSVEHVLKYIQLLRERYSFLDIHVIDPELEFTLTKKNNGV